MLAPWCSIQTLCTTSPLEHLKKPWNRGQNLTFFCKDLETARHIHD